MYSLLNEFISCIQIKWGKEDFNGDSTTTKNPCGCHFITTGSILLPFTSCPKGEETFGSSWDQVRSSCVRYGQVVWTTFVWRKCKRRCLGLLGNDDRYLKACMANKTSDWLDTEKKLPVTFYLIVQRHWEKLSRVTWSPFASKWIRPMRTFVDCFHLKLKAMHITTIPLFQILQRISKWRSLFNWAKMKEQNFKNLWLNFHHWFHEPQFECNQMKWKLTAFSTSVAN